MGNLCSIFHAHFDKLVAFTQNHNKAVFLDKCIFWWQISTYKLDDDKIWFTRKISEIAKELFVSERSISRFLEEFEEKGLIERTCRLSSSKKNNQFSVTKRLYIHVTEKLLNLVQIKITERAGSLNKSPDCSFSIQHGEIDNANLAVSIYKEKDYKNIVNTTVSKSSFVDKVSFPIYSVENDIGERLSQREKNYIKGMMHNLQILHGVQLSSPEEIFAEIVFSVLNESQLTGITSFNHRIQIISKLLRQNRWSTPRGFYNHSGFGEKFRRRVPKTDAPFIDKRLKTETTNNKHILEKQIKALNDKKSQLTLELLSEQRQRSSLGRYENEALITSIESKVQHLTKELLELDEELSQLKAALEKASTPGYQQHTFGNKFQDYEALCEEQARHALLLDTARKDWDYALTNAPDDTLLVQSVSESYRQKTRAFKELEDKIYRLSEELYGNKVA